LQAFDGGLDQVDGGGARFDHAAHRFQAVLLFDRVQAEVDRRIQVAGRIAGAGVAGLVGVEDGNPLAGLDQQHGGGQAGDAGADDGDVDLEIGLQGRQAGQFRRRAFPE
jgi:hypothetical protein